MVPGYIPSTRLIVAALFWVTLPMWGGLLAGGISSQDMPYLKTLGDLLVALPLGWLASLEQSLWG